MAATLPRDADTAASWAATNTGSYPGLCDHFVGLAYGLPHSGFESAAVHWQQTPSNLKSPGDRKPPVGALVFWDTGKKYGHVAIVSGYTKSGEPLITTTHANGGAPTVMTLDQAGMSYLGWATPYFGGKTAPVDMGTVGVPRAAGSKTEGTAGYESDESGVAVEPVTPDKLNKRELAAEYGYAWRVIKANPELRALFMEAFNNEDGQWTEKKFGLAVKETDWYKNNAEYARNAFIAEKTGGADWQAQLEEANLKVADAALALGVTLTDAEKEDFARRYIYEGWNLLARGDLLQKELGARVGKDGAALAGSSANIADTLKQIAEANGVKYNDEYYADAARRVAIGVATAEDVQRQVREDAASAWPTYADRIMAGANVRDLASAYINTYAKAMEKDPYSIDLNDPKLRAAMTGVDEKGNFKPMGLWEFEQSLRKDPKWMDTKQAQDEVTNIGVGILKRMGFVGG
jgi:CHAP domain